MSETRAALEEIFKRHRRAEEDLPPELCDWCGDAYFPCPDRKAAAKALGVDPVDGSYDAAAPAGYIVAHDGGTRLTVASCGAYDTQEGAEYAAGSYGEGWAVYAAYPVGSAR